MSNLKQAIKQEYLKCVQDSSYFINKFCVIQHPQRGKIKFELYPFQEEVLKIYQEESYNVILKSRQLGISTLTAAYSLWMMLFQNDKNVLCIATAKDTAKNLVTKVRIMYDNLPSWLKTQIIENNKLSLTFKNGSQIKAIASNESAGRSEALSLLVLDEAAFIDRIDDKADDNGTGRWMLNYAVELGCSVSMLNAALDSRFISKGKDDRKKISKTIKESHRNYEIDIDSLSKAYKFCRLINFIQAFSLINSANKNYGWDISISDALNVWSNGSIIKSNLINSLFKDYSVEDILSDKKIFKDLGELKPNLIDTLSSSLKNDISLPCFNEGLNYFNQISNPSLSTKLIQAQRNYFGSHPIKIN